MRQSLFILLFSVPVFAGAIRFVEPPMKSVEVSGVKIPLYSQALLQLRQNEGNGLNLYLTGAGIREKKVVLASLNVYFAASYTDRKEGLDVGRPLDSLEKTRARVMRMTFVRDVGAEKLSGGFEDALKENGISVETPEFKQLFSHMKHEMKKGESLTIIGIIRGNAQRLTLEFPQDSIHIEGAKVVSDFWKIWFGKPLDSGLERLQPKLLKVDFSQS